VTGVLTVEGRVVAVMDGHPPDVAGHVLAADTATASARLLAIADVICSASDTPERWLVRSLAARSPSPRPETTCSPPPVLDSY